MNGEWSSLPRTASVAGRSRRSEGAYQVEKESSVRLSPPLVKKILTVSVVTLLWAWFMIGTDSSPEMSQHVKVVFLDRNKFEWVARNFGAPAYYPQRIFDAQPALVDLLTLQVLAANATSDREIIVRVMDYFGANRHMLQEKWQDTNSQRIQALFAMNVIHLSHPYGPSETPHTFMDYVHRTASSSCRLYAIFQSKILDAFGLSWRFVAISSGFHGWIEVKIGDRWEIFDSTANVWVDQSAFDLLDGRPRRYRWFYTPWSDADRPDARQFVTPLIEPYYDTAGGLRSNMPGLGIYFLTPSYLREKGLQLEVWANFCPGAFQGMKCLKA